MTKKKGLHCQHLLVKSDKRNVLQSYLAHILQKIEELPGKNTVKWVLDVDPVDSH
jgi:primosomal protein N'